MNFFVFLLKTQIQIEKVLFEGFAAITITFNGLCMILYFQFIIQSNKTHILKEFILKPLYIILL